MGSIFIRRSAAATIAISIVFLSSTAVLAAPTFEAVGPIDSQVTGMSADGQVIVGSFLFGAPSFRWTRDGGTEIIGGNGGLARVSRDGSTISGNLIVDGHNEAALWLGGTDWMGLGGFSDTGCPDFSNNYGISGDGSVIVGLGWEGCQARAFRWEQSTGMVDLGSFIEGRSSRANAVNDDGSVVVGWDDAENGNRRGARWVNGVESLLIENSNPALFLGEAQAVTPDGSVIVGGPAGPAQGQWTEAYLWTEADGGKLIGSLPGGGQLASSFAFVVSDDGTVAAGASGAQFRNAFVWTQASGMLNFQDYLVALGVTGLDGWRLDTILGMSGDARSISGWGETPQGRITGWLVENLPPFVDNDNDNVLDGVDNCSQARNNGQLDSDGDGYGNLCDGDFDGNCVVGPADYAFMQNALGTNDPNADFNRDGTVDVFDLAIFSSLWRTVPGPSGVPGACG